LALVSARITRDSARGWARFPATARTLLAAFDAILPQDAASEARLKTLGAATGALANLKEAAAALPHDPAELARLRAMVGDRQVVLAASTHPGEEALVAEAVGDLDAGRVLLVLAPR